MRGGRTVAGNPVRLLVVSALLAATGCAHNVTPQGAMSPLRYDAREIDGANEIVVFIPGALASVEIFAPATELKAPGQAFVYYRFPGLDGLPLDHDLVIDHAAKQIAEFANAHPAERVRLLGYSTGGAIALVATQYLDGAGAKVAALSPAVPKAGGLATTVRGAIDIAAASARAGSLDRAVVWREYYRTLLFGRAGLSDPALAERIDQLARSQADNIVIPEHDLAHAHTEDLSHWKTPAGFSVNSDNVAFFVGTEDPVFSMRQTRKFAEAIGVSTIVEYPDGGHLLFLTHPGVFEDIFTFFAGGEVR
jgi:pimeloyl-ACP methyl ester carboxylesterase